MTDSEAYARIGEYIESHQSDSYSDIGRKLGLSRHQVARIARLRGIKRRPGNRVSLEAAIAAIEATSRKPDCASAGEVANPLAEEYISTARDAPSAEDAQAPTPDTTPAEIPVA